MYVSVCLCYAGCAWALKNIPSGGARRVGDREQGGGPCVWCQGAQPRK